ncbi:MAG: nodulation S family protein [Pseudomonadota bacterium]|nr:nodulation S family protein [Pseudomonadota bacterium]
MTSYADPGYFEQLYTTDPDPWRFATSDYERDKYAATLEAVPQGRSARVFEVGCSIGVLTRQLAANCDELLAVDVSQTALKQAESRCEDMPWVHFACMDVRHEWPAGSFDLILFSEVLYYLGLDGIRLAARRSLDSLSPHGAIMLVNWHGETDGACTGDAAADLFIAACRPRLAPTRQERAAQYRLDVLR